MEGCSNFNTVRMSAINIPKQMKITRKKDPINPRTK
jgi:hypothetical protein